jgi:pimeloyl-ACP methyl ester carboxylesterase
MNGFVIIGAALLALVASAAPLQSPTPPDQPPAGPGGRSYLHERVRITQIGSGVEEVYLFEPANPAPERAPVVVFGHGWGAMDPDLYGSWIAHIVKRGFTVVYPRYQADLRTPVRSSFSARFVASSACGVKSRTGDHARPDERGLVFVGHSMGGLVATNLAVRAAQGDLPPPLALMVVAPGKTWPMGSPIAFQLEDLSALPSSMLLVAVVFDDDDFVRDIDARKIYTGATAVPRENRDYIQIFSDDHGVPTLVADHRAATAPGRLIDGPPGLRRVRFGAGAFPPEEGSRGPRVTDALDYYGTWKLLDGLADAVFRGVHREYALGGTPEQRFMGLWSDRVPVRELQVREP